MASAFPGFPDTADNLFPPLRELQLTPDHTVPPSEAHSSDPAWNMHMILQRSCSFRS